jgi:hypothetical protein
LNSQAFTYILNSICRALEGEGEGEGDRCRQRQGGWKSEDNT